MSQYRLLRHVVAVATLGAVAASGCFVVDDKKDDDGDGSAGESSGGDSGSGGSRTGGTGGTRTGGTGGGETGGASGSATGGSGGACVPSGGTCLDPTDCCAVLEGTGYCVSGSCADACEVDSECSTNCCAELTNGSFACGPADICEGVPPGGAVMKFCSELYKDGAVAPLTVEFMGVRATTDSGTCTPIVPNACIDIPTGSNPSVALIDGTTEIVSGSFPDFVVADGDEIIVVATVDDVGDPTALADTFANIYGTPCATTDPFTVMSSPLETKSARFNMSVERDLRRGLDPSLPRWTRRATPLIK